MRPCLSSRPALNSLTYCSPFRSTLSKMELLQLTSTQPMHHLFLKERSNERPPRLDAWMNESRVGLAFFCFSERRTGSSTNRPGNEIICRRFLVISSSVAGRFGQTTDRRVMCKRCGQIGRCRRRRRWPGRPPPPSSLYWPPGDWSRRNAQVTVIGVDSCSTVPRFGV